MDLDDEVESSFKNNSIEIRPNTSFEIRPQNQYKYRDEVEENVIYRMLECYLNESNK